MRCWTTWKAAAWRTSTIKRTRPTGLVRDHAPAVGRSESRVASIAATGFGLSALCIAAHRKYMPPSICEQRVEMTLAFLLEQCPHVHGFLYHFLDIESGERLLARSCPRSTRLSCSPAFCYVASISAEIYAFMRWRPPSTIASIGNGC